MATSYEVTDGAKVYGTFSSQSKADALKRELKAEGVKARVRITYDAKPAKTKKAAEPKIPKTVKKSTPKPVKAKPIKPKAAPAKPKEAPKVREKPKDAPKTKGPLFKIRAEGFAVPPKDYKGSKVPLDYINRALEKHLDCILPDGRLVQIEAESYYVKVVTRPGMESEQWLLQFYDYPVLESDGKYLKLTYREKNVDWYLIEGGLDYPDVPVAPERPKIDYSTCSIEQLIDVLYEGQKPGAQFMEKAEIRAMLSDPFKTVELYDTFLHRSLHSGHNYTRWLELGLTSDDMSDVRDRLYDLKVQAQAYIDSTVPDEPPAPVEKPKRGLFKKKSKTKTGLAARDDFLKRIEGPLKKLGMNVVPVTKADFTLVDPAHICMVQFNSRTGESLFGLPGEPSFSGIDISQVRQNLGSYFDADGNPIPARLKADANKTLNNTKMPQLNLIGSYTVDPATFKKELTRANKIGATDWVLLYGRGGDLMLSNGEDKPGKHCTLNGMRADVGDGNDVEAVSAFPLDYFLKLADLMVQADGPCTMDLDNEYPVAIRCSIGDFDVLMMLAPRRMEECVI